MSEKTKPQVTAADDDYSMEAVPESARKGFRSMFFVMLGFTFFSASMSVGAKLGNGLDLNGFAAACVIGGVILSAYCGILAYIGSDTGMSMDLLCRRAFGKKGSYLSSLVLGLTQIGWFGVGSFVSGGTATPNFARFAKNGKAGAITTVVAFFIGNSLMFFFGAVSSIFVGGNDIFEVMVRLNLFYLAVLVLGLNIWTTNDNALYTAGLGLANIFHQRKKPMVLLSGIIGTVASVWLYYNFCGWLNILNCTLPPVGMILVLAYFMNKEDFETDQPKLKTIDWFAVAGVILGAIVANLLHWGIASINGMVVAAVCYCVGQAVNKRK